MALKEGDLKSTILKKVSIDEFEPKTGSAQDVMVIGMYLNEIAPAKDLYHFINNSIIEIRDVEVSPNPNSDRITPCHVKSQHANIQVGHLFTQARKC